MLRIFIRFLVIGILMSPLTTLAADQPPRLVLQITVDQLRGDLPAKHLDKMGEGGFRYLLDKGIVYENAHHAHSNTETIVGHATLATGAYPADHGLIGNFRSYHLTVHNLSTGIYYQLQNNLAL